MNVTSPAQLTSLAVSARFARFGGHGVGFWSVLGWVAYGVPIHGSAAHGFRERRLHSLHRDRHAGDPGVQP